MQDDILAYGPTAQITELSGWRINKGWPGSGTMQIRAGVAAAKWVVLLVGVSVGPRQIPPVRPPGKSWCPGMDPGGTDPGCCSKAPEDEYDDLNGEGTAGV